MKKIIPAILVAILVISNASAQTSVEEYVRDGVNLHDAGNYNGAIEKYEKALKIDKKSGLANYEIASTYFALKNYDKAIDYSDKIISGKLEFADRAYILKGSAQDLDGKSKDAIKTYRSALKEYPDNHLLYYNYAYTSYNLKEYKDAEEALKKALKIKPSHASSHLLLGYINIDKGSRVRGLLCIYNFLLLEPKGKRAVSALDELNVQLKKGVKKENEKTTTITLSPSDASDDFSAAELMVSLLEASKNIEKNEGKSEPELFWNNTESFFAILGELKKDSKGFWWEYYVDFFYSLKQGNHTEAFCYYISQSKDDSKIQDWLKANKDKIEALSNWYSGYERKK